MNFSSVFSQALPNLSGLTGRSGLPTSSDTNAAPIGDGQRALANTTEASLNTITGQSIPYGQSQSTGYIPNFQWTTPSSGTPRTPAPGAAAATTPSLRNQTVEEIVVRHQQKILDEILRQTEAETRLTVENNLETRIDRMFEQDRNDWLGAIVGYRSMGESARQDIQNPLAYTTTTTDSLPVLPASQSMTNNSNAWTQTQALMLGTGSREGHLDAQFVLEHYNIVSQSSNATETTERLKIFVAQVVSNQSNDPILAGYSTAWDMTSVLLRMGSNFSPVELASATLVHFCEQFETVLNERVQSGIDSGAVTVSPTFLDPGTQTFQLYANLVFGPNPNVWTILYYCLRVGNAKAALEIWTNMGGSGLPDTHRNAVARILQIMSHSGTKCFWENGIPAIPLSDRRVIEEMIDRQDSLDDIHQHGVLVLLTGYQDLRTDDTTAGFSDIEDYLFGRTWKALLAPNPVEELKEFGHDMQSNGSYFQDEHSGGWSYALPLLASQQYARAFSHLAGSGRDVLLQATHLAMVWAAGGIPISDLGDEGTQSRHILAFIVEAYANAVVAEPSLGPLAALEYLARIPEKSLAVKAVAKLIVTTGSLFDLAGSLTEDGLRVEGAPLDKHFDHKFLILILLEAAGIAQRSVDDDYKVNLAVMSYMLAGKYDSVLVLLNKMISPPDKLGGNRDYWIQQSNQFYEKYIVRRTQVDHVLTRTNKQGLLATGRTLVKLHDFFELVDTSRFAQAWGVIQELDLIPKVESELNEKVRQYRMNVEESIRSCYPAVLVGSMKSLYGQHAQLKKEMHGVAGTIVLHQLKQLRDQASLLVKFSGLVDMSPDEMEKLSQAEALMI